MIYKPNNGDIIKLLPILKKSNKLEIFIPFDSVFLENKMIYDLTGKNYLRRMTMKNKPSIPLVKKYFLSIYTKNQIKFMSVGKQIMEIISPVNFDFRNNDHFKINIEMVNGKYHNYQSSYIVSKNWNRPINSDNAEDWENWIRLEQPGYIEDYLEENSIYKNIEILKRSFGDNFLSEIISDDRNRKIETILN
jgi:hypothetical protein